ncbi:MAG: hypothetical protein L6V81_06105 [Clostridium sp.]|nr:MAG: hypothetical protein L6V81_06105 [Clostridium sp.]
MVISSEKLNIFLYKNYPILNAGEIPPNVFEMPLPQSPEPYIPKKLVELLALAVRNHQ